jgi:hypothetical protein
MCCVSVPPVLLPVVKATHALTLIVPVAGDAGLPEMVYVNFVEEITLVTVTVPLYCD